MIEKIRRNRLSDLDVIGRLLSPACYIDQSLPAVLYLAARYADDFEAALIATAGVGVPGVVRKPKARMATANSLAVTIQTLIRRGGAIA